MTSPTIGVGMTTRNRNAQALANLDRIIDLTPGALVILVDDASDDPVENADYRFEENVGIARAKNKCLELLDECDHIFLFDDDAYPLVCDWWKPYVESPEPHLMRIFEDLAGPRKLRDITKLYEDQRHVAWSGARGVMLYIDAKKVLPVVGGMDPIYGKWGYEHGDWSNRIHNAGLTSWRYADVQDSSYLIHSMDEFEEIERSVDLADRRSLARANAKIHNLRRDDGYTAYCEYREFSKAPAPGDRDVVITHLYSSKPDPQRPTEQYPPTLEPAAELLNSVRGADSVVINDASLDSKWWDERHPGPVELVESRLAINVFFQRHLDSWRYLRDHPEIRYAWCVDATDVEMLHEPWDHMEPGTLYIGYENKTVADPWLRKNHPTKSVQWHIKRHGSDQLLNPGVIGGDRETVMAFLHDLVRWYFDTELHRFLGHEMARPDLGDMGAVQVVAKRHQDHLMTGPTVVTEFRKFDREAASWFRHK